MTYYDEEIREANCHGTVTFYGESLSTPAWAVLNALTLWGSAEKDQPKRQIPYATNTMTFASRRTGTDRNLEMIVVGNVDWTGQVYADPIEGLERNIEYLLDEVFDREATTDNGLLILTYPSGRTRQAYASVGRVDFEPGGPPGTATMNVPIFIPDGRLGDFSGS